MQVWSVGRSKDGLFVHADRVPFWAWAAQGLADESCAALERLTGLCLINPPEWTYRLRWGKPDEDGYTEACLGHCIWAFGQNFLRGFGAWRREKELARFPVSREQVRQWYPGDSVLLDEDECQG